MPPEPSDRDLLAAIVRGDEVAFARLYERYGKALFRYLITLVDDRGAAEDLLQEVFLAVWNGAGKFQGRALVRTWLYRIAHHQAMSYLRRRRLWLPLDGLTLAGGDDPVEAAEHTWQIAEVRRALARLSPPHRAVVELTFVHGFSYREIAEVLGCPIGTVKSRMRYALRYLRATLRVEAGADDWD